MFTYLRIAQCLGVTRSLRDCMRSLCLTQSRQQHFFRVHRDDSLCRQMKT